MATPEAALKLEIARLTGTFLHSPPLIIFSDSKLQVPLIVIDLEEAKHDLRTRRRARPTSTLRTSPHHHQKHTFARNLKPPVLYNPQVQVHLLQYVLLQALAPRPRSHKTLPLMGSCSRVPSALSSAKTSCPLPNPSPLLPVLVPVYSHSSLGTD